MEQDADRRILAALGTLVLICRRSAAKTQVTFFYPVQVGGPLTKVIDGYVAKFEAANPTSRSARSTPETIWTRPQSH